MLTLFATKNILQHALLYAAIFEEKKALFHISEKCPHINFISKNVMQTGKIAVE